MDGDGDFDGELRPGGEHRLLGDGCPENHAKLSRAGGGDKRRNVMTRMKLKDEWSSWLVKVTVHPRESAFS